MTASGSRVRRERALLAVQYLDPWMVLAGGGLAPESYDRVREEIVDHFYEALDAGVERGLDLDAAAREAVEALGPAYKARRQFRRTYLTKTQADLVRSFAALPHPQKPPSWLARHSRIALGGALTLIVTTAVLLDPSADRSQLFGLACTLVMACGTAALASAPRIFRGGRQRAAVIVAACGEVGIWGGYLMAFGQGRSPLSWLLALFLAVLVITVAPMLSKLPAKAGSRTD